MDFFDSLNPGDVLRNIKQIVHCPFCGSDYQDRNIKIIGRHSKNYILHLLCRECGNHIVANLAYQERRNGRGLMVNEDMAFSEEIFEFVKRGSISNDEVMDFFKNLDEFDGNFQKITRDRKSVK